LKPGVVEAINEESMGDKGDAQGENLREAGPAVGASSLEAVLKHDTSSWFDIIL
jgi:hypothetical protein